MIWCESFFGKYEHVLWQYLPELPHFNSVVLLALVIFPLLKFTDKWAKGNILIFMTKGNRPRRSRYFVALNFVCTGYRIIIFPAQGRKHLIC